jgi:hypothetical protein
MEEVAKCFVPYFHTSTRATQSKLRMMFPCSKSFITNVSTPRNYNCVPLTIVVRKK